MDARQLNVTARFVRTIGIPHGPKVSAQTVLILRVSRLGVCSVRCHCFGVKWLQGWYTSCNNDTVVLRPFDRAPSQLMLVNRLKYSYVAELTCTSIINPQNPLNQKR